MQKSDSIGALAGALSRFQAEVPSIEKNHHVRVATKKGGEYSFQYATMDKILETVRPALAKHKLAYTHLISASAGVMCILMHESGEWIATGYLGILPSEAGAASPQDIGSAISYAKRYTLCAILGIAPDESDGNGKQPSSDTRAWLNKDTPEWDKTIEAIREGRCTVAYVLEKRRVSKPNREELEAIENAVAS